LAGVERQQGGPDRLCPAIVGPTAIGKTALILQLAREFPLEVISLDSRQIYRGLRIGTAQPSAAEQAACRHHLVDFLPPAETYSAQRFRRDFGVCWQGITARGRLPILVGGAGFYLKAVSEGLFDLPPGNEQRLAAIRAEVAALADQDLAAELARVDPPTAARLHPHDRYRRQRALEIFRLSGRPASELAAGQTPTAMLDLAFPVVRLERPVGELDARIRARTAAMLAGGWVAETEDLLQRHAADCPGLRSLGYAAIVRMLAGALPAADLAPSIALATRQYAKRQRTWFRRIDVVAAGAPADPAVLDAVRRLVRQGLEGLARG
jgi:tRNA dimethylallyltransferase